MSKNNNAKKEHDPPVLFMLGPSDNEEELDEQMDPTKANIL
jgi:hypothetical protein